MNISLAEIHRRAVVRLRRADQNVCPAFEDRTLHGACCKEVCHTEDSRTWFVWEEVRLCSEETAGVLSDNLPLQLSRRGPSRASAAVRPGLGASTDRAPSRFHRHHATRSPQQQAAIRCRPAERHSRPARQHRGAERCRRYAAQGEPEIRRDRGFRNRLTLYNRCASSIEQTLSPNEGPINEHQ